MKLLLDGKWDAEEYIKDCLIGREDLRKKFVEAREKYREQKRKLKGEVKRAERFIREGQQVK